MGCCRTVLNVLVEKVQETCNLGMLDGDQVIYIGWFERNWPLRMRLDVGSRVPPHCTAIGKLLLAYMSARERDRLLDMLALCNQPRTKNSPSPTPIARMED
jgi:IclR family transcriptional regulator, acetate operon repressor